MGVMGMYIEAMEQLEKIDPKKLKNGLCFLITRPIAPATAGSLIIRQTKPKKKNT